MDADKKDVALDDEALDAVTGAALIDAMKRIGESLKTDLDKGAGIGGMGISAVIGAGIGAYVGLIKGIKNEIFRSQGAAVTAGRRPLRRRPTHIAD